jgi:hypothetical protein
VDIAIISINANHVINDELVAFFYESDKNIYCKSDLIEKEIMEGD